MSVAASRMEAGNFINDRLQPCSRKPIMIRFTLALTITGGLLLCLVTGCGGNSAPSGTAPAKYMYSRSDDDASGVPAVRSRGALPDSSAIADFETAPEATSFGAERHRAKDGFTPRSGRQSGILTAGSFDDVANYCEYTSFINRYRHQATTCQLPLNANLQQTVIRVTDGQGKPLGDVRCVVKDPHAGQQQHERILLDMCTGTDGRVLLLSNFADHDRQRQSKRLHLQIFTGPNQTPVIDEYRDVDSVWSVAVHQAESRLPTQLDLALVIDTTGSMGDELGYLKTEIDSIVASVHRMFPNVDQRYSLIAYRDNGDAYVCRTHDFTDSLDDFRRRLDSQAASGGGDFPEAMDVALNSAENLSWRTSNTARVLFLVGDAPPHRENVGAAMSAVQGLRQKGVRLFPVGASGVETTAQIVMRTASLLTMGQYLFLTDHSGVGNAHTTPDVSEFAVERLDQLMIRMIASELAGKRLGPQEVIAIEHGERYTTTVPIPQYRPAPQAAAAFCVVDSVSTLTLLLQWIDRNSLAALVAVISGVVVFDRLSVRFQVTSQTAFQPAESPHRC
ncbi:MAG TPA: VWA domain-containing protein [Fuerstia sp.]|nr:VWA domain-containing protein [Fuerstiella sp.]